MTPKMLKALDFIETYHRENRIMPNLEEIRLALGLAGRSGAHRMVERLIASGHLIRARTGARNLSLPAHPDLANVPTEDLQLELRRRKAHG